MTTANKLTIFRVVLIPVFLILTYAGRMGWALAVFIFASLILYIIFFFQFFLFILFFKSIFSQNIFFNLVI